MKKLLDLRFVIGAFFSAVGFLLCIYHFTAEEKIPDASPVNLLTGLVFLAFGIFMIVLSSVAKVPED